jgi:hypothetical protein
MPIPLTCACGRSLRIKDDLAGRNIKCPQCGAVLTVPTPDPAAEGGSAAPQQDDLWGGAAPRPDSAQQAAEEVEELSEVLPAGPDEGDGDEGEKDEEELSTRERVRRREERARERAERREEEEAAKRRRKKRKQKAFNALAEKGRFNVKGSRGYLGNVNAGVGAGIAMIVLGVVLATIFLVCAGQVSNRGSVVIFFPGIGLIVGGIAAIVRGMNNSRWV